MSVTAATVQTIDLTDLRNPILSSEQLAALRDAEAHPVTFNLDAVLDAARAETGLSDFGAMDFLERLCIWLQAMEEDTNASAFTRLDIFRMIVRYAATRLRLEDLIRRHPEILDIEIDRPIVVGGLPRSGTTHMLSLLAADRRLRSLPWWEAIAPIPTAADAPTADDPNPRRTRAEYGYRIGTKLLPYMQLMHEFSPDHISEDIELQGIDLSSYILDFMAIVPRWRDYYFEHDQTGTYKYLKRTLQALTFLRGPNRWVIKCPQHMEQMPAVFKAFPDATLVLTHRDPVASLQSIMTASLYVNRIGRKKIDPETVAARWPDRYERMLRACVRDRDTIPSAQTIDVYFHEWIRDPDSALREIYRRAELPLTDGTLAELHAYLKATEIKTTSKFGYNLERDFGVAPEQLRRRFSFYFERFPIQIEAR